MAGPTAGEMAHRCYCSAQASCPPGAGALFRSRRQRSEQYLTSSQTRSHFLRQVNGRPHRAQILVGRSAFLRIATASKLLDRVPRRADAGLARAIATVQAMMSGII